MNFCVDCKFFQKDERWVSKNSLCLNAKITPRDLVTGEYLYNRCKDQRSFDENGNGGNCGFSGKYFESKEK